MLRHNAVASIHVSLSGTQSRLSLMDSEELSKFIQTLTQDLAANPEEWENKTLSGFLEALSAWVQDMDGYYKNNHLTVPTWMTVAEMLLAAKYYE